MRCTSCQTYIPQGLPSPVKCPQCGKIYTAPVEPAPPVVAPSQPVPVVEAPVLTKPAAPEVNSQPGFAPFFTIRTRLSLAPLGVTARPSFGSLSFGRDGFSIVWDGGLGWEKVLYRDLGPAHMRDNAVLLNTRNIESKLTLYSSTAPLWWAKATSNLTGSSRKRATIFLELLSRVKDGLSPIEISTYQRKLQ